MKDFPHHPLPVPKGWDRKGLPARTYHSDAMMALERDLLFRTHWQVVGHENDLPAAGDWLTFDLLGERALVIRGQDGALRGFHNLCRHPAAPGWSMGRRGNAGGRWSARFMAGSTTPTVPCAAPRSRNHSAPPRARNLA